MQKSVTAAPPSGWSVKERRLVVPLRVSIKSNTAVFCFGFLLVSLNFPDYFSAICCSNVPHNKMAYMRAAETSIHRAFASSIPGDIRLMFAYGSGVFKQLGHADEKVWRHAIVQIFVDNLCVNDFKRWSLRFADVQCVFSVQGNMLDYIVVVDDSVRWHADNLARNRLHYSFLKYGGAKFITEIQRGFGAGIYFNTLVRFEDRVSKRNALVSQIHWLLHTSIDWLIDPHFDWLIWLSFMPVGRLIDQRIVRSIDWLIESLAAMKMYRFVKICCLFFITL